jgi:hypothetical protein
MPPLKKMRLGSADTWPPENNVVPDEGPLLQFPGEKTPTVQSGAVIIDEGVTYTTEKPEIDFSNLCLNLSQLAVIKLKRYIYRAVQLKSKTAVVYMIISADTERSLIQKHIRLKDRKVNYRLWFDNSTAQKKPQSQTDRNLFGEHCFLSSLLCDQLKTEKLEKLDRKARNTPARTDTVTIKISFDTDISLSATDAIALLNGSKKLILSDKIQN